MCARAMHKWSLNIYFILFIWGTRLPVVHVTSLINTLVVFWLRIIELLKTFETLIMFWNLCVLSIEWESNSSGYETLILFFFPPNPPQTLVLLFRSMSKSLLVYTSPKFTQLSNKVPHTGMRYVWLTPYRRVHSPTQDMHQKYLVYNSSNDKKLIITNIFMKEP